MNHHDLALMEIPHFPPPAELSMSDSTVAINHVAITLPNREVWLQQIVFLQSKGVQFYRRINHGRTHSVYISDPNGYGMEVLYELPYDVWGGGIDAALNTAESLPTKGAEALVDETDNVSVSGRRVALAGSSPLSV